MPRRYFLSFSLLALSMQAIAADERIWSYDYYDNGLLKWQDGPRTDVVDQTDYEYDAQGNLTRITNSLGQQTLLQNYTGQGLPQLIVDPNGTATELAYNWRGQITRSTVQSAQGHAVTVYTHDPVGLLKQVDFPDGTFIKYEHDAARRLTAVENSVGERIEYELDAMGNRMKENIRSGDGAIAKTQQQVFDELGRLIQVISAAQHTTRYAYDANGNLTETTDAKTQKTTQHYDALNRLTKIVDPHLKESLFEYDAQDNLTGVTDPRNLKTLYTYNFMGEVIRQDSPDTGTTSYVRDNAGNVTQKTDARAIVTQYRYDALNRLTATSYPANPAENVVYGYDSTADGNEGIGRLTRITDRSGYTAYRYDDRGNVVTETREIENRVYHTQYGRDLADKILSVTYPTGRIVSYGYDSAGRVATVKTRETASAPEVLVAQAVTYLPFGQMSGWTYGNGMTHQLQYNQDYQLTDIQSGVLNKTYNYDPVGNISSIQDHLDAAKSQAFSYDPLSRLTDADGLYGQITYRYDEVGNRTGRDIVRGSETTQETYTYDSASNRLLAVAVDRNGVPDNRSLSYLPTGQIDLDQRSGQQLQYVYSQQNRLEELKKDNVTQALYVHNALGQRVVKVATDPAANIHFHYGPDGQILAETAPTGDALREYIYLNGLQVALIEQGPTNQAPYFTSTPISSVTTGQNYLYSLHAGDADGDDLSYSLDTAPAGMSLVGTALSWAPTVADVGDHPIRVAVSDGTATTEQNFTLSVTAPANQAPQIISTAPTDATATQAYSYPITATDANNDTLSYSLSTAPAGMTISPSGLITWTPTTGQVGNHPVTVSVSDGTAATTQSFSLAVASAPNQVPVITSTEVTTATEHTAYGYDVDATDGDNDTLGYVLTLAPTGMTIHATTGLITWTPAADQAGTHPVVVEARDGRGGVAQQSFNILVSAGPAAGYSLRFSGDDLISIPPLNLSGDFDLEFAFTAHPGNLSEKYRIMGRSSQWTHTVEARQTSFLFKENGTAYTFTTWRYAIGERAEVKITRRGTTLSLYKNGTLLGSKTTYGAVVAPNQIGRTHSTDYFKGDIEYLTVTNYATATDSRHYALDEGAGTTANDSVNVKHGTIGGTPHWVAP